MHTTLNWIVIALLLTVLTAIAGTVLSAWRRDREATLEGH